ncbi:MAG: O-antigen ligase family protein, partial [Campylobacterales bacterium]
GLLLQRVDIGGSLFEIWSNLTEDLYILVATLLLYRTRGEILRILGHLATGYLIITFASGLEVVKFYLEKGWAFLMDRSNRAPYYWWGGFARLSALYLPITAGWAVVVWPRLTSLLRWVVGIGIGLGFLLMLLYRSSGPIVLTSGGLLLLLLLRLNPKKGWFLVGLIGLVGGAFLFDRTIGERKIFNPREYDLFHNQWSFNGRGGQWKGFLEMLDTPKKVLFGYGYGWKKFGEIGALHYRERFKREGNWNGYRFFCCYGSANPHNGYLEVLIESGIVGEVLFLFLLGYGFKLGWEGGEIGQNVGLPFLLSYTLNSILNGYWEGNGGKLLFLIISLLFLSRHLSHPLAERTEKRERGG